MNSVTVRDEWVNRLANAIASALREFAPRLNGSKVALFAVDCHPWHGRIGLAILTGTELDADPVLFDPAEMAAWQHFDFARELMSRQLFVGLQREMETAYRTNDRPAVAEAFLRACSAAAASQEVTAALTLLETSPAFRISVAHPDDGREFFQAASGEI